MQRLRAVMAGIAITCLLAACSNASDQPMEDANTMVSYVPEQIAPVDNGSSEAIRTCNRSSGSGVLLSFDDYGEPEQIEAILERLHEHNMRAAFFPTGEWALQHLDLIAEIRAEGHIVGNHTMTHARLGELSENDPDEFYAEVYPLEGVASTDPMLLRTPYEDGAYDELVGERLTEKNTQLCTWTADSHDWDGSTLDQMMDRLENGDEFSEPLQPDGVVLAHMFGEHSPELVDSLVAYLDQQGWAYEQLSPTP